MRDEAAHAKALILQRDRQGFALGVSSHMADVLFDKHVVLADEFVAEMFTRPQFLMEKLLDPEATRTQADRRGDLIRKHALWMSPEVQWKLEEFAQAVRNTAAGSALAAEHPSMAQASAPGEAPQRQLLFRQIIEMLRSAMGIPQLLKLRQDMLRRQD